MTNDNDYLLCAVCKGQQSTLSFSDAEFSSIRVRPADLARLLGVSKTSVSKWVKSGKVTLGPDGRVDPSVAVQELLRKTHLPALRARIFRQATLSADLQRQRIQELERETRILQKQLRDLATTHVSIPDFNRELEARLRHRANKQLMNLFSALWQQFDHLVECRAEGIDSFLAHLCNMRDEHFYSHAPNWRGAGIDSIFAPREPIKPPEDLS